ncbi:hypothetical protein [Pandoraea terrae]|uniref:hypothetical protein n=1 Tax=Pandoraea terrae TaxID=1537710 RepID=UPI0012401DE7|nr:hypothetical protein [Pandoraea terrae]
MLSPHEFATLMLLKDAPDQVDMTRPDLEALLERQLVELDRLASGHQRPRVTARGHHLLQRVERIH